MLQVCLLGSNFYQDYKSTTSFFVKRYVDATLIYARRKFIIFKLLSVLTLLQIS